MSRILACAALVLICCGCSESRQLSLYYQKAEVSDIEAAKDKKTLSSVSGVTNVIFENSGGGIRAHIMVEDGKELKVYEKADELGYIRQK